MTVILSPRSEKQLRKLPKIAQIAVAKKIRSLRDFSVVSGEEKLAGYTNIFRVRVGDYRIAYRKTVPELYIILIHHRRDVYRLLRQLLD